MTAYRLLLLTLLSALCALGLVNWRLATTPIDIAPVTASETNAVTEPNTPTGQANEVLPRRRALAELTETRARPLFLPERRPAPPQQEETTAEQQAEPVPEPEITGMRLVGMMRLGSDNQRALIRAPGKTHASWVTIGEEIGGWKVRAIEPDKVVVENANRRAELMLRAPPPPETDAASDPEPR